MAKPNPSDMDAHRNLGIEDSPLGKDFASRVYDIAHSGNTSGLEQLRADVQASSDAWSSRLKERLSSQQNISNSVAAQARGLKGLGKRIRKNVRGSLG